MYITCQRCQSKFIITFEQLGSSGKKVRCSKCGNLWHQKLDDQLKIEPIISQPKVTNEPIITGINLPAVLPVKVAPFLHGLPVLLIGIIVFMVITLFPNALNLRSMLNKNDLDIDDLYVTYSEDFSKMIVKYKILNNSKKNIQMEFIRTRLLNKHNKVVESRIDDYTKIALQPMQILNIKTEFIIESNELENVEVMLGNKLDFILK